MFSRARIRGSGGPSPSSTTLNRSAGRRLTISFAVRFCAFVFASSANDGVNTVIMRILVGYALVSPLLSIALLHTDLKTLISNRSPVAGKELPTAPPEKSPVPAGVRCLSRA